jgi:Ni,Fe-hydrogenase III large subunit
METKFQAITNGEAIRRDDIGHLPLAEFRDEALALVNAGAKVVQFFGTEVVDGLLPTIAVMRLDDQLWLATTDLPETYASLTQEAEVFHLFERELAEQFGVTPEDHPWLRMVRYHPNYADRPDVFDNDYAVDIPGNYSYYSVAGDEIHEVAVGPVHAGVIEPGHFRFNCIGERVLNLEISLGFQHRGIEPMLPDATAGRRQLLVETIAGDTTAGHSHCHAQAIEALADLSVSKPDHMVRTAALELERLANHTGDLGALSGDVAFLPPANYCGRMRGDLLNMTLWFCGNRFSRGLVVPGGVGVTLEPVDYETVLGRLTELRPQLEHVIDLLFSTSTVRARFDGCGRVTREDAEHLGLVGPAGRASGMDYDARRVFPTGHYNQLDIPGCQPFTGDVYARARIRADEIISSVALLQDLLPKMKSTQATAIEPHTLAPSSLVVTLNEAWRGEVSHCVLTDAQGKIERYKIKDPSFHNWNGLAMSLRDTGISDFPLNNKSFNLSYCGHDL